MLKTETQTVNGYVANYEKYFSFIPEIAFDQFVFTLTAEKYSGECLDQLFSLTNLYICVRKFPHYPSGTALNLDLLAHIYGRLDSKYDARTKFIIIGSDGTVWNIYTQNIGMLQNIDQNGQLLHLHQCLEGEGDGWVPELRDGYTIIVTHTIVLDGENDD